MADRIDHREIYCKGRYVTVSRRDLPGGGYRVRVLVTDILGAVEHDVHKDFDDVHDADSAYVKQIRKYEEMAGIR